MPTGFDTDGQVIAPEAVQVALDGAGAFSVDLWPNERGLRGTGYVVTLIRTVNGQPQNRIYGTIAVPDSTTASFNLLFGVPVPTGLDAAVILTAAEYAALAPPDPGALYLVTGSW